jgi:hypothetical protein
MMIKETVEIPVTRTLPFDVVDESAYSKEGVYIGTVKTAMLLTDDKKIEEFHPAYEGGKVCSTGFSSELEMWFGWSHRAIRGFGIGYVVENTNLFDENFPLGFAADTMGEARMIATAFANCIS